MKKFMALVLALVMVLGLATVGTNAAAYKDANDINYDEAVEVMSAVGVLKGDENGFRPADTLKRSEGAKIIAYLLLGNKTAEAIVGSGNKFTDVPASHWAVGFIEYLASIGVVGGVGDGKFDPNGDLTAVQFAKMLLVALGYDAELEGLVGADWSINTQKLVNEIDLFDGMDLVGSAPIKREEAAQSCLNALQATMVKYRDKGTTVKIGESVVVTGATNAEKDTDESKEYLVGGDSDNRQLTEYLYGNDLKLSVGHDVFGAPANKWTYKNEEVGTFVSDDDLIFTKNGSVKTNALYDLVGKTAYDNMVKGNDKLVVWKNGDDTNIAANKDKIEEYIKKNTSNTIAGTGNGSVTAIYKTKIAGTAYDKYTIVIKNELVVQATNDYNKTNESVSIKWLDTIDGPNTPTKIMQEDFDVSGVKEDDYLIVTYADGKIQSVAPATVLKGDVTTYKAGDSVTIDGTKYNYNMLVKADGKNEAFEVGSKATLILDSFGYIVCVDDAKTAEDYLYLQDIENDKTNNATVYFTDGTSKTVTVKKIEKYVFTGEVTNQKSGVVLASETNYRNFGAENILSGWYWDRTLNDGNGEYVLQNAPFDGRWYAYSVDDAGRYTLKQLSLDYVNASHILYAEGETVTEKNKVNFLGETGPKANTDTVVLVLDDDENVTVYTGIANIPTIKVEESDIADYKAYVAGFAKESDNFAKYVFIDASDAKTIVDDTSATSNLLFVLKKADEDKVTKVAGDKAYYEADILLNGELVEGAMIKSDYYADYVVGKMVKNARTNADGYYAQKEAFNGEKDKSGNGTQATRPIEYTKGTLSIGGVDYILNGNITLIYKKDCKAMNDPAKDYEVSQVSGSYLASTLKNYNYEYEFFGQLTDKDNMTLKNAYVYVTTCTEPAA